MRSFRKNCLLSSGLALVLGVGAGAVGHQAQAADEVTQERLLNADKEPGNWLLHHKDYSSLRYSTLDQINRNTVKNLKVAWTLQLGGVEGGGIWTHGGLEGTPLAENGFLYVTDGWGSVYKIDTHGGHGQLVWKMGLNEGASTALNPYSDSAQTACSRLEPQPKFSPARRMLAPA